MSGLYFFTLVFVDRLRCHLLRFASHDSHTYIHICLYTIRTQAHTKTNIHTHASTILVYVVCFVFYFLRFWCVRSVFFIFSPIFGYKITSAVTNLFSFLQMKIQNKTIPNRPGESYESKQFNLLVLARHCCFDSKRLTIRTKNKWVQWLFIIMCPMCVHLSSANCILSSCIMLIFELIHSV